MTQARSRFFFSESFLNSDWAERTLGHADEVKRPEPGSQRPQAKLPGSRDFR